MPARPRAAALAAALALLAAPAAGATKARPVRAAHPDVGAEQDCAACHRTGTPDAFRAWERSAHGVALVKCVVCHGSTGKDFRARPAATGCQGCHPANAALAPDARRDCFACHAPHALTANPHRRGTRP